MNINMPRNAVTTVLCLIALPVWASPSDVPTNHWAKPSVDRVTKEGLMSSDNGKFRGDKPVTRYELAVTLDKLVRYIEAGRAPLHPTKRPGTVSVPAGASRSVKEAIRDLVGQSFLPADSPIVKGNGDAVVTADQLATALSQITIRLSDRSLAPEQD